MSEIMLIVCGLLLFLGFACFAAYEVLIYLASRFIQRVNDNLQRNKVKEV